MKKILIIGVVGLILGIAGGTLFKVVTAPPVPPVVAAADSVAGHGTNADSSVVRPPSDSAGAEPGDTIDVRGAADSAHAAPGDSTGAQQDTTRSDGATDSTTVDGSLATAPVPPVAPVVPDTVSARMARIFGSMKPDAAAAVLSKLQDEEVRAVLMHLSDRKAAAILSSFPGERAATLTRTILSDARGIR
jgi:hypothetical protein